MDEVSWRSDASLGCETPPFKRGGQSSARPRTGPSLEPTVGQRPSRAGGLFGQDKIFATDAHRYAQIFTVLYSSRHQRGRHSFSQNETPDPTS